MGHRQEPWSPTYSGRGSRVRASAAVVGGPGLARFRGEAQTVKYLLDSNIIIAAIDGANLVLHDRLATCDEDDIVTSAIVFAEVAHGSNHGKPPPLEMLIKF